MCVDLLNFIGKCWMNIWVLIGFLCSVFVFKEVLRLVFLGGKYRVFCIGVFGCVRWGGWRGGRDFYGDGLGDGWV